MYSFNGDGISESSYSDSDHDARKKEVVNTSVRTPSRESSVTKTLNLNDYHHM